MSTADSQVQTQSVTMSPTLDTGNTPSKQETSIDEAPSVDHPKRRSAWIRYRTELRHRITGELLHRVDSNMRKNREDDSSGEGPILELVTRYDTNTSGFQAENQQATSWIGQSSASAPAYSLRIYSTALINALQAVVEYYPGQNLSGTSVEIKWPYPVLVHHYDQLRDFKVKCQSKHPSELCAREKDAPEHIDHLIRFLDDNIMERVVTEQERLKEGFFTFENYWVAHKPGRTVATLNKQGIWSPYVISELTGGSFENPPTSWTIHGWNLNFDGRYLGRNKFQIHTARFDGEFDLSINTCFIDDLNNIGGGSLEDSVLYGETWYKLLQKRCRHHMGKSLEFPYNEIDGLVMADLQTYYMQSDSRPDLLSDTDCRKWSSDCTCSVCQKRVLEGPRKVESPFDYYNKIVPSECESLSRHMYLLCPSTIHGFVFKKRIWEQLHVKNLHEPEFNESMIDNLVMDQARIKILKALAKSFIRVNQRGKDIEHDPWAADFVKGKGSGLIFLLHGKPGVGKTVTAESIAEYCERPLMVLTSADIGTDAEFVEANLTDNFKTARSWGAVLLIDEADVFMERRGTADLERNSLVAAFLRALEFYDGLLFLTTNRVGAFDDAFISRIHVQLFYKDFTDDERQQVWMTFMQKLTKERGKYIRITMDAKDYIRGAEIRAVKWNGREIRNAFQTAVSLAEYEDERDEEGKIKLTDEHLRAVVELSKDFKEYLRDLHKADEDKRALRRYERLDT